MKKMIAVLLLLCLLAGTYGLAAAGSACICPVFSFKI